MIEKSYVTIVEDIKDQIRSAQNRAILNANKEMLFYIGILVKLLMKIALGVVNF